MGNDAGEDEVDAGDEINHWWWRKNDELELLNPKTLFTLGLWVHENYVYTKLRLHQIMRAYN